MRSLILSIPFILSSLLGASTLSVYEVWQPLSLHGTDVDGVAENESGVDYAVVMSRPVVLSGAMPENLVHAVAMSHRMASIGRYAVEEANLVRLYNIKFLTDLSEDGLKITVDLNQVKVADGVEIDLLSAVKLSIRALKVTLERYAGNYLREDMLVKLVVVSPKDADPRLKDLNKRFLLKAKQNEPTSAGKADL